MVKLNNSCFGNFMKLSEMFQFQGQLLLHLLFKQAKELRGDKIIFHVYKSEAEFGPTEFALITGLTFGPKYPLPQKSSFCKKLWGAFDPEKLVMQDIEDAFYDVKNRGGGEVCLKLALLLLLYGVILPKEKTYKQIDMEYVHLVDNLDEFNNYPWGTIGYDLLVRELRKFMNYPWFPTKGSVLKKPSRKHINLYGFTYALQIWSYEAIPCVGNYCARKFFDDAIPRMLRWEVTQFFRFAELTLNCFPSQLKEGVQSIVLRNLIPSSKEESTRFYKNVQGLSTTRSAKRIKRKRNDAVDTPKRKEEEGHIAREGFEVNSHKSEPNKIEDSMKINNLISDIGKLNHNHKKIDMKLDRILENQRLIMERLGYFERDDGVKLLEFEDARDENSSYCHDASEWCFQIDAYTPSEDNIEHNNVDIEDGDLCFFNLVLIEIPVGADSAFRKWYTNSSTPPIFVSVGEYPETHREWFERIWNPRGWLCSENVDALMYLVLYKSKKWPKQFSQNWTVIDLMFWGHITGGVYNNWSKTPKKDRAHFDWVKEKLISDYLLGNYPIHGPRLPWSQAKRVFGVAHVNKNHWVLYEIRIEEKVIIVYDSLSGGYRRANPRHLSEIRKVASLMPSIQRSLFRDNEECSEKPESWEVKTFTDTPQQKDSDSCDILCIKMLECITCGRSITEIDPFRSDEYRRRYCYELFREEFIQLTS